MSIINSENPGEHAASQEGCVADSPTGSTSVKIKGYRELPQGHPQRSHPVD
jgi:hypothetical protein